MLPLTDTWRANAERIRQSGFRGRNVNQDNARFLADVRANYGPRAYPIFVGGQVGPKGDAYAPEQALPTEEAERFHKTKIEALAEARVDYLFESIDATMPAPPTGYAVNGVHPGVLLDALRASGASPQ